MKQFCNRLRSIANRCNFENKDKHIKTELILGTHSPKLRKFCFTNPKVSLEEVVNRGKLFEEIDEQKGVVEGSKSINEIKNLEKNEQSLQIHLKLLQEQIIKLKSNQKSKPKTQEYINRRTIQKSCFKCGRSWPPRNDECPAKKKKKKILQNAENQIILSKFVSLLILMLLIMKMIMLLEHLNSCDIASSRASMQNFKVQLQKSMANIKIGNVKVKFLIDTRK